LFFKIYDLAANDQAPIMASDFFAPFSVKTKNWFNSAYFAKPKDRF
jgi:hypothetical protein